MNIIIKNNPIGEFVVNLSEKHGKHLLFSPSHDRSFIEHNLVAFLMLLLSYLTSQNPNKKIRKGIAMTFWIYETLNYLGKKGVDLEKPGEYSWTLMPQYSARINIRTKIRDMEKADWYIDQFLKIIFEILMLPREEERRERGWKKNNITIKLKDLANKF